MFAISKREPRRGLWHVETEPAVEPPGPGEVAVAVLKAGICGTDFHIYTWDAWSSGRVKVPMTIGHEFVGRVLSYGPGVGHLRIGQRVSAECHIPCGTCFHCRSGDAHICTDVTIIGVDRPGCFTEVVTLPADNVWPIPDEIPDHHAAVFDPIGNAMHAVTATEVAGEDVLVAGAGPIGLFAAAIARSFGARTVTVAEPAPFRAGLARRIGVDQVVDPTRADAERRIRDIARGGPGVVLEMSGNARAIAESIAIARNGATIVLMGIPEGAVTLPLAEHVIMRGLTLKGITGRRMYRTWFQVESFVRRRPEMVDAIVTHVLPANDYARGFELIESGHCGKVVLDFESLRRAAE